MEVSVRVEAEPLEKGTPSAPVARSVARQRQGSGRTKPSCRARSRWNAKTARKELSAPAVYTQQCLVTTGDIRSFDGNCIIQTLPKALTLGTCSF